MAQISKFHKGSKIWDADTQTDEGTILHDANSGSFTILPNGNIGIGTSSPASLITSVTTSNTNNIQLRRSSGETGSYAQLGFRISANENVGNFAEIRGIRTNRINDVDTDLAFLTATAGGGTTEKMRIRDDGNVGIGTNAPLLPLSISTNTNLGVQIRRNGDGAGLLSSLGFRVSSGNLADNMAEVRAVRTNRAVSGDTDLRIATQSNGTLAERMTIRDDGNVGIGTATPTVALEVNGLAKVDGAPSNTQTANYTLVLADKGRVIRINSSSNLTLTIPLNSSVAFPIDTEIAVLRYGTGTVSISPTSGVTLNSKNAERKISGQYGSVALKKIGTNEWVLVGSLEA